MPRPITDTLRLLHGGTFIDECSEVLAGVVRGVQETGQAGKVTITLEIKSVGAALSVLAKVTDKTPEKPADADLFYGTVEGNLSINNPNQRTLDLRSVDEAPRKVNEVVDQQTGEIKIAS